MPILPLASVERLIRSANAERVSESAASALLDILEDYGVKIAKEAIIYANHAGRKTVKDEDIKLAFDMLTKPRD
ncbi:histone family protein [Methanococcoides methylutens]|uniref:Archaeal histone n=1 Tax=Methanococcoides methylutens MM1 TaxID=1434104 RepID=A0A0E3X0P2_METMT|nr:histone family protein [Methanococcoides methylutens]AKB85919.1 Archaeal histone [Methanococcoides methylutens MM1]